MVRGLAGRWLAEISDGLRFWEWLSARVSIRIGRSFLTPRCHVMRSELFKQFEGRRVLLTGHTGFKGSWLALWLRQLGAEVVGIAEEPPTDPSHFEVASVASKIDKSIIGDIRDYAWLADVVSETRPELVMHLAAQSVVRTGYDDPLLTFSTNVMGTANVLEAVRQLKRPCALFVVTSDKCYENVEQTWGYRECDAMGDHDPYGGSKGAAELVVRTYRHSYFPVNRLDDHGVWLASARAGIPAASSRRWRT